jgi:hypothetical protein
MKLNNLPKTLPEINFRECIVKSRILKGILVDDIFFQSKVLAYFIQKNSILYAYCIHFRDATLMKNIELAEKQLLSSLETRLENPKCINPGVIFDWQIEDVEKILRLLEMKNVKYLQKEKRIVPEHAKIGFVFNAPAFYQGNCEFCSQTNCSYRKYPFNYEIRDKILNAS